MWITSSLTKALTPTAVALGNFDGVHRGHQQVIQPVVKTTLEARAINSCSGLTYANKKIYSTVVTFNPHPQEFFTGSRRTLLTPLNEKVQQLTDLGVEQLVLLPFDRELAALSPQEFVEKILVQQLQAQQISVGQDFRFGYQRSGTASDLQAIAATSGIPVTIIPLQNIGGDSSIKTVDERISSSSIRQALEQGDLHRAKILLGRPYTLTGRIVEGQQLGRTIGFPTANIQLPPEKFLPRQGVYAVQVFGEDESKELGAVFNHEELFARQQNKKVSETPTPSPLASCLGQSPASLTPLSFKGVMNIGSRPTVNGTYPSVEVHLLDWSGDLYGKTLTVQLEKFLRPEQKFASLEALKAQIQADCARARSVLTLES
ncbi:MAG: bifunctional riboflavin kinase/FAD synthetase [Gloeocapsa sp. UFS-A4-WI-NPMV-4B04]|jgi:riboflavin kinase/FMN adenylyltransferase|nr:bifunctional riboflavin kinase/FAD synthetase [Gloeocapsa sp. UFS-A4-WI-NPMV-4B04]